MFVTLLFLAHFFSAIGAINWGLFVFFDFNLVTYVTVFVKVAALEKILYAVIALSGVFALVSVFTSI